MESLFSNGSDERFVTYCRHGPIAPLNKARRLLIQCSIREAASTRAEFTYCVRPLISLLRCSRLGLFARLALAQEHLVLLFRYAAAVTRLPTLSLLGKDFAYSAISLGLDRKGLIEAIVFTTSNYNSQPLWVRGLPNTKLHLVWYAQNFKPVSYAADSVGSEIPCARWVRVDTHWVWTGPLAITSGHWDTVEQSKWWGRLSGTCRNQGPHHQAALISLYSISRPLATTLHCMRADTSPTTTMSTI